jgi:hypothetical protein
MIVSSQPLGQSQRSKELSLAFAFLSRTHRVVEVILLRRLLLVPLHDAELCLVLGILHDVPVEGLREFSGGVPPVPMELSGHQSYLPSMLVTDASTPRASHRTIALGDRPLSPRLVERHSGLDTPSSGRTTAMRRTHLFVLPVHPRRLDQLRLDLLDRVLPDQPRNTRPTRTEKRRNGRTGFDWRWTTIV